MGSLDKRARNTLLRSFAITTSFRIFAIHRYISRFAVYLLSKKDEILQSHMKNLVFFLRVLLPRYLLLQCVPDDRVLRLKQHLPNNENWEPE